MTTERPLYFDHMATTPVDERVAQRMWEFMTLAGEFGNPASTSHVFGQHAQAAVTRAREQVARLINAQSEEIVWTSGATESNNLALFGAACFYRTSGRHIITCKTEHKAVLDCTKQLEREGFSLTYLTPQANGLLNLDELASAITADTILVSVMHANNEIGVIQDLAAIAALIKPKGILFHVDAAQSAGKIAIDVTHMKVDLLSLSAHKLYGPKGVGALYVRRKPRVRLQPMMWGGGQENGLRAGTLPTHQIVGMGEACELAQQEMAVEAERLIALRDRLLTQLQAANCVVHGDHKARLPGNLNVSFVGVDGKTLLKNLPELALSNTSACTTESVQPSHVLLALGIEKSLAEGAIRFGLGRYTTAAEVDRCAKLVLQAVARIRQN